MDRENMDLFLARLKAMEILDDSPKEENEKFWEQRLEADIQKLKTFRFIVSVRQDSGYKNNHQPLILNTKRLMVIDIGSVK